MSATLDIQSVLLKILQAEHPSVVLVSGQLVSGRKFSGMVKSVDSLLTLVINDDEKINVDDIVPETFQHSPLDRELQLA